MPRLYCSFLITILVRSLYSQSIPSAYSDSILLNMAQSSKTGFVNANTRFQEATYNHPKMSIGMSSQGVKETIIEIRNSSFPKGTSIAVKRYQGSVFFVDEFSMGTVRIASGKMMQLPIRYNLLKDQITIIVDNKEVEVYNTSFILDHHTFIPLRGGRGYVEILYKGGLYLLKKYSCELVPIKQTEDAQIGRSGRYDGEVAKQTTYWVMINSKLKKIELTKESIAAILNNSNEEFNTYLTNEVNVIDESVLIYLLKTYDKTDQPQIRQD